MGINRFFEVAPQLLFPLGLACARNGLGTGVAELTTLKYPKYPLSVQRL